jgi:hypothetical protein
MPLSLLSLSGTTLHLLPVSLSLFGSLVSSLPSRSHFRRYRERRVPFSCFALPDPFSAILGASSPVFMFCTPGPVFMFCAPGPVFDGTDGVRSHFHVFHSWLVFDGIDGAGSHFHVLRIRTHFRQYRRRRVPFSCFALPDSFSPVSPFSVPFSSACDTTPLDLAACETSLFCAIFPRICSPDLTYPWLCSLLSLSPSPSHPHSTLAVTSDWSL